MSISMMSTDTGSANFEEWLAQDKHEVVNQGQYKKRMQQKGWYDVGCSEPSSVATSSAGSPFDQFTSLFDTNVMLTQQSDRDTLFTTSNEASLINSPTQVKTEEDELGVQFMPELMNMALELKTFSGVVTPPEAVSSTDLVQRSNDHSNDEADEQANNDDDENNNNEEQQKCGVAATPKTELGHVGKRRRAPRKRLTPHQKEAHNKIEKRYRININTKIAKLQQIIPWVASEKTAFEVEDSLKSKSPSAMSLDGAAAASGNSKLNKSMILEKAVDYILYLQNNERLYEMEVQRLKRELENLKTKC